MHYEAWYVEDTSTLEWKFQHLHKETDRVAVDFEKEKCGKASQTSEIRFYCESDTGDLGGKTDGATTTKGTWTTEFTKDGVQPCVFSTNGLPGTETPKNPATGVDFWTNGNAVETAPFGHSRHYWGVWNCCDGFVCPGCAGANCGNDPVVFLPNSPEKKNSMSFSNLSFLFALISILSSLPQESGFFEDAELHKHYQVFDRELRSCSDDQLGKKRRSQDLSLSVAATWEKALRSHEKSEHPINTDWFVGFLEGRLTVETPDFWNTLFQRVIVNERRFTSIRFGDFERGLRETQFKFSCPEKMSVSEIDEEYLIEHNEAIIRLPKGFVRQYPLVTLSNVESATDLNLIAVYEQGQNTYQLHAANSDEIAWSSTGVVGGNPVLSSGPGRRHYLEVIVVENRAFVFGITSESAHVNAFDLSNGKSIFRFSTAWFCKRR